MRLSALTDDIVRIILPPLRHMNAYVVGDVLVDAGLGLHARGILKALGDRTVTAHVVTHAHGDHVGGSKTVSDARGRTTRAGPRRPVPCKRSFAGGRSRSRASCGTAMRSAPASPSWTSRATRPVRSRCGASAIAR